MILDWIMREGWLLPVWWALISLAGFAAYPLCLRLLNGLPDKGYTFARAIGMLLVAFVYWLMASYGFIENNTGGMILAWLIVLTLGLVAYFGFGEGINWRVYWQENKRLILAAELLFLVLFLTWAVYRAYQNDTFYTEKPMEMAFISGIMRSETFPPNDPWMAGYSISYYYFGYVMTAMLSMLSGVHSGYGFSMMIISLFALTGLSVFGVGYNLVRSRAFEWGGQLREDASSHNPAIITGVLATCFVLLIGNLQIPLIEIPYQSQSMPAAYFEFWDVQGYTDVEADGYTQTNSIFSISTPFTDPNRWAGAGWFGWEASRVLVDYDVNGQEARVQPINEFPAFSFLLMDVHPHVLALPFVTMALGLALNIVLSRQEPNRAQIVLYALVIGGLIFLNTWDAPIYLVILSGAEALRRLLNRGGRLHLADWLRIAGFGAVLAVIAAIAYLPFLVGFRSQAGGLIPNLITPTYLTNYFIMFGAFLLLSLAFLGQEVWIGSQQGRMNWLFGFSVAGAIFGILLLLFFLFILIGWLLPETRNLVSDFVGANGGWDVVLPVILNRRLGTLILPLLLTLGIALIVARLFPAFSGKTDDNTDSLTYSPATGIALLLLAAAFVVTLVPEFFFLRDNFSTRINTIFKFYYQAWVFFAIVSAYAVYSLLLEPRSASSRLGRMAFAGVLVFVLITGLAFPIFGTYTRAVLELSRHSLPLEQQRQLSLDGRANNLNVNYYQTVLCLGNYVQGDNGVIAESSDLNYNSQYGRVGAFTGLPTVINWENHQGQWRGSSYPEIAGSRRADIDQLYQDVRWDMVVPIIEEYGIDYIMYGATERNQYGSAGEEKFIEHLPYICEYGDVRVYVVGQDVPSGIE